MKASLSYNRLRPSRTDRIERYVERPKIATAHIGSCPHGEPGYLENSYSSSTRPENKVNSMAGYNRVRSGAERAINASHLKNSQTQQQHSNDGLNLVRLRCYPSQTSYSSIFSQGVLETQNTLPSAKQSSESIQPVLQQSYFEAYVEYASTWCLILNRELLHAHTEFSESSFLKEGLAVLGSNLRPPLIDHVHPSEHYKRAKAHFYSNNESNQLVRICGVMLLQYWSSNPEGSDSLDSNWWWTGVAIRLAQESGLHHELRSTQNGVQANLAGLRRRIW